MTSNSNFITFCETEMKRLAYMSDASCPPTISGLDNYERSWTYAIMFANDTNRTIVTNNENLSTLQQQAITALHELNHKSFSDMSSNDWAIWNTTYPLGISNLNRFYKEWHIYNHIYNNMNKRNELLEKIRQYKENL